jgi:hypothetical protein
MEILRHSSAQTFKLASASSDDNWTWGGSPVVAAAWSLTALRSRMKAFSLAGGVELARRRCITDRMTGERSTRRSAPRRGGAGAAWTWWRGALGRDSACCGVSMALGSLCVFVNESNDRAWLVVRSEHTPCIGSFSTVPRYPRVAMRRSWNQNDLLRGCWPITFVITALLAADGRALRDASVAATRTCRPRRAMPSD